jgi:hypothetical protein
MAVVADVQCVGDAGVRAEIAAAVEHVLASRPGDWRVSIIGSHENDNWEMKIHGANAFERSYTLIGASGEHRPEVIRVLLEQMLPKQQL